MGRPVETLRLAGLSVRAFVGVLCLGVLAGAGAFLWTIESAPEAVRRGMPGLRAGDPDPAFGSKARQAYALGGDIDLEASAEVRRATAPGDPEGWLFGAFAHERLAGWPGLGAVEHRAEADRLWEQLLEWSRDPMRRWQGAEYYEGWALLHLGRPVLARERWGAHLETARPSPSGILHYNTACYLALAGDAEGALASWRRAALSEALDPLWSVRDPDLELIAGSLDFEVWFHWQRLRRETRRMWRWRGGDGTEDPGLRDDPGPVFLRTE